MPSTITPAPAASRSVSLGSLRVEQLTRNIGAELSGVNLVDAIDDHALFAQLRALLLKHRVLFLRDQELTRAEHIAFARRFGELELSPLTEDPAHPGLVAIYKSAETTFQYENAWHTDGIYRETPAMGCVLRCLECPDVGGDTLWINMVMAYDKLPDFIKKRIANLRARNSIETVFGANMPTEKRHELYARMPPVEHPVVRTHPETGEKILYVCPFTTNFVNYFTPEHVRNGLDYDPGASELMTYLTRQAHNPDYQVRFRWKPNSVAIWDNRSTQHYAVYDYAGTPRKMERAGIIGDRPY